MSQILQPSSMKMVSRLLLTRRISSHVRTIIPYHEALLPPPVVVVVAIPTTPKDPEQVDRPLTTQTLSTLNR